MKRRTFLTFCSATGMTPVIGSWAADKNLTPNERPAIASIGVGGKGWADSQGAAAFGEMIAFCDVNTGRNRKGGWWAAKDKWPKATPHNDWRKLLEQHADQLDGITVTTPDHMHAPITMAALQLGIACYTQKPLTRTIYESRQLAAAAEAAGVATQMGNQHHNGTTYKTLVEWIRSGTIGKIREVRAWSNRPVWPQGIDRPTEKMTAPDTLDWDLWLGGAPERPYHSSYQPFNWRAWYDFGAGALGDMGAHILDPPVWALELGPPTHVHFAAIQGDPKSETFPKSERIEFFFAKTKHTIGDHLRVSWSDGECGPQAKANELPDDFAYPSGGSLYVGETGTLVAKHGSNGLPQLFRDRKEVKAEEHGLPTVAGVNHYRQWIDAIRGEDKTTSHFGYAGPLTETVLLGTVACRSLGEHLEWNPEELKFDNSAAATALVKQPYRKGWEVEGLG